MARVSARAISFKLRLFGVASKARWDVLRPGPCHYDHLEDDCDGDWHELIRRLSAGEVMHSVYDAMSANDTQSRRLSTMAPNGRMAIVRSREGGAWTARSMPTELVC